VILETVRPLGVGTRSGFLHRRCPTLLVTDPCRPRHLGLGTRDIAPRCGLRILSFTPFNVLGASPVYRARPRPVELCVGARLTMNAAQNGRCTFALPIIRHGSSPRLGCATGRLPVVVGNISFNSLCLITKNHSV